MSKCLLSWQFEFILLICGIKRQEGLNGARWLGCSPSRLWSLWLWMSTRLFLLILLMMWLHFLDIFKQRFWPSSPSVAAWISYKQLRRTANSRDCFFASVTRHSCPETDSISQQSLCRLWSLNIYTHFSPAWPTSQGLVVQSAAQQFAVWVYSYGTWVSLQLLSLYYKRGKEQFSGRELAVVSAFQQS